MNLSQLKEQYNSIKDSLQCLVNDSNYVQFESHIQMLKTMAEIENRSIAIYDLHQKRFLVKQDANIALLGYDSDESDHNNIEKYHEKVHPDDIGFLYETEIMAHDFFHSIPAQERKNYKLIYDFRVKSKSGMYLRFMHQLLVFECDSEQKSWLLLILTDVIEENATEKRPRRYMMDIRTKQISLFNDSIVKRKHLFTKREREILYLLAQGLESDAIADKLFISINTVNNHRQNILSKTGAANTTQVLIFAKRIAMI